MVSPLDGILLRSGYKSLQVHTGYLLNLVLIFDMDIYSCMANKLKPLRQIVRALTCFLLSLLNVFVQDMPRLHNGRLVYYTPCLQSAIQSQVIQLQYGCISNLILLLSLQQLYYFQSSKVLDDLLSRMDPIPTDELELQQETEQLMDSFSKISIVGHHQHLPTNN